MKLCERLWPCNFEIDEVDDPWIAIKTLYRNFTRNWPKLEPCGAPWLCNYVRKTTQTQNIQSWRPLNSNKSFAKLYIVTLQEVALSWSLAELPEFVTTSINTTQTRNIQSWRLLNSKKSFHHNNTKNCLKMYLREGLWLWNFEIDEVDDPWTATKTSQIPCTMHNPTIETITQTLLHRLRRRLRVPRCPCTQSIHLTGGGPTSRRASPTPI